MSGPGAAGVHARREQAATRAAGYDQALAQAMTQEQQDRAAAAMKAGWAFRFDPVRLEFTAARELHVARTLDELLAVIEAGPS